MLAPWIVSNFPKHRVYVEPFCGAASVLLRKPRSYSEVINDLDGEAVNLFRVLRDTASAAELERQLRLTPFARDEFVGAYTPCNDPVEQARRTLVKSFMGFGSAAVTACAQRKQWFRATRGTPTGFRANSNRSGTSPAHDWANWPDNIAGLCERLQGVVIENRDASEIMLQHDSAATLHYVDPPYVHATRSKESHGRQAEYRHEMTDDDHRKLAQVLRDLEGAVVLSGYPSELYDDLFCDWTKVTKDAHADGARDRVECLWLSPNCPSGSLF